MDDEEFDITKALDKLMDDGKLKKIIDLESGEEPTYMMSEKGMKEVQNDIRTKPEAFAFVFTLTWNSMVEELKNIDDIPQQILLILDSCKSFKDMSDVELYDAVIEFNIADDLDFDIMKFKRKCFEDIIKKKDDVVEPKDDIKESKDEVLSKAEHKIRHEKLHKKLDELIADFIDHNYIMKKPLILRKTSIMDLMKWSHQQSLNPTERPQDLAKIEAKEKDDTNKRT